MPEYEIREKNIYDRMPTEEESNISALAMAKAQLSLGISPEQSAKIIEKLEPGYLSYMNSMINYIPTYTSQIIQPYIEPMALDVYEQINDVVNENIHIDPIIKKISRFFSNLIS